MKSPPFASSREIRNLESELKSRKFLASIRAADWWIYEVLGLALSGTALTTMIVLLSQLNNKPQPSWAIAGSHCTTAPGSDETECHGIGISINSVVSWLGTIARICLLVPLSNRLGQLKWSWFSDKDRPLPDLIAFDSASRGLSGSLQLIWRLGARNPCGPPWAKRLTKFKVSCNSRRTGYLPECSARPLRTNLVGYYTQPVFDPSQTAYVSNNSIFDGPSWRNMHASDISINPIVKASIWDALYSSDPRQIWSQPHHVCSTGDCIWPPVASIGMCTSCEDMTSRVQKSCASSDTMKGGTHCNLILPSSQKITEDIIIAYDYEGLHHIEGTFFKMFRNEGNLITGMESREVVSIYLDIDAREAAATEAHAYSYSDQGPGYVSSNCTVSPCVQSIRSVYKQSSQTTGTPYREEILRTWPLDIVSTNYTLPFAPEYGLHNQTFDILSDSYMGISKFFGTNFGGKYRKDGRSKNMYENDHENDEHLTGADDIFAIWNSNYTGHDRVHKDNRVSCAMELVAKGISKSFRDRPWIVNGTQGTVGEAFSPVTFVRVTWYWISLPIAIWVLALVTFLGTAWKSTKPGSQVWRNDPLPLVFMRLVDDRQRTGGVSRRNLTERAEGIQGRLQADHGDIRLTNSAYANNVVSK